MAAQENKWHNQPGYDFAVAGVLFVTPEGWLIMQHRDGNTPNSPNLASFFGGHMEHDDASPAHAAAREASEETNRIVTADSIVPLAEYTYLIRPGLTEKVHVFTLSNQTTDGLEVYEGQGYHVVKDASDPLIAPVVQHVVTQWFAGKARG